MDAWYAVHAKMHRESLVARELSGKAIPVFLPLVEVVRRRGTRRVASLEPLFPNYLFVRLNGNAADWCAVRWMPGVRRIVGTDDTPVAVPGEVIEAIQNRLRGRGFVRPGFTMTPGSRVRIQRGPLEGVEAVLERPLNRATRVRVLLDLLGQPRPVDLDALDIEPV